MKQMKKLIIIIVMLNAFLFGGMIGCQELKDLEPHVQPIQEMVESKEAAAIANNPAVTSATGGISSLVYLGGLIASNLATGIFAINRQALANKRKQVIEEVERNPDTPSVREQVQRGDAKVKREAFKITF